MHKKITIVLTVLIVIVGLSLVILALNREQAPLKPIKVGVLADLSGDYASYFRGIPRGAEIAVKDLERETGREIDLIIEDQKSCDSKETVTIMNKFLGIDKVDVIIGGTCSNTTLAGAPLAEKAKTIMISPGSSAPSITEAGDYIFRVYISDAFRGEEIAKLAYELGKRRMAMIIDNSNDTAIETAKASREIFRALGGKVVIAEEAGRNDTDFRTYLSKMKEVSPDVLYVAFMGSNQIGSLAKQTKEMGIDIQIITPHETIESNEVIEIAKQAVEGAIYAVPGNPPETTALMKLQLLYEEEYGEDVLPPYTAETYDAVMLGVKAFLMSDGTKEDIKDKLYEVSETYQGLSGNVQFDENGDVSKEVIFKTIKDGQFVLY